MVEAGQHPAESDKADILRTRRQGQRHRRLVARVRLRDRLGDMTAHDMTVSLTLPQAFDVALKFYAAGQFAEAERVCLRILSADAGSAATLNLLAVIDASLGRPEGALANYDRALALQPDFIQALNNRGAVLKAMRRHDEALESYDRALALRPDHIEVLNNRAGVLQSLGRHREALEGYDCVLALRPDHPQALNNRGVALQALQRPAEALRSYDTALGIAPDFVEALVNRGIVRHELGLFSEALTDHDRAIALRPGNADALCNRGNTLDRLGRHQEALASYDGALELQPDHLDALCNRGIVLRRLRRFDDALASYDAALRSCPDHRDGLAGRGATLHDQRKFGEALKCHDRVIALDPTCARALVDHGAALHAARRPVEALQSFERALAVEPDNVEALTNRGVVRCDLGRYQEALADHARAIALRPRDAAVLNNRGVALHKLGRLELSLASHDAALGIDPDHVKSLADRAAALHELKRFTEAAASCQRAIALRPDYADAHFFKSLTSLLGGDFERGWDEYEWRRCAPAAAITPRHFAQPLWRGDVAIAGRTILLHAEQGFGDTIQFCRYVALVRERGARVVLEVEAPLCRLMRGVAGASLILAKGDALPDFDLHCPLPSLPRAFATRLDTIPARTPYLRVPGPALQMLPAGRAPKIGLAWAGNPNHARDRDRSIALRDLLPLLDADATFVSLQKQPHPGDFETLQGRDVLQFGDRLLDFADTAALVAQLDLVISVDTSIAHLAGAVGTPVWILLTHVPDWRWLLDRDDSPWYPSARLFRQGENREWGGVVARVGDALRQWIGNRASGSGNPAAPQAQNRPIGS